MNKCTICERENELEAIICIGCGYPLNVSKSELREGTELSGGKYMIIRKLGKGGFGITYLTRDIILDRVVVIKEMFLEGSTRNDKKVIPPDNLIHEYKNFLDKFILEAKSIAGISHQNIVSIYDVFLENNTAYMVMEYIEGETLKKYLESGKILTETEMLPLIKEIIYAVRELHEHNKIHRDIKDENIIIQKNGRIKLIDFGSSRNFISGETNDLTRIITPGYAAPEQLSTKGRFGPHTDIYSIGVLMYKMVTGELPPDSAMRLIEENSDERIKRKLKEKNVSQSIQDIILGTLEINVNNRIKNCEQLLSAIIQNITVENNAIEKKENKSEIDKKRYKNMDIFDIIFDPFTMIEEFVDFVERKVPILDNYLGHIILTLGSWGIYGVAIVKLIGFILDIL